MAFERKVSRVVAVYEVTADGIVGTVPEYEHLGIRVNAESVDHAQELMRKSVDETLGNQVKIDSRLE